MAVDARVYIVDDESVRDAVTWLIGTVGLPTTSYAWGGEFLAHVPANAKGCLILDLRMPEVGGFQVLLELREHGANLPTIVLTGHGDVPAGVRAMKLGVVDFMEKLFNNEILIETVQYALSRLGPDDPEPAPPAGGGIAAFNFTPRERQVLALLVSGHSNKEIADRLGISVKTAEYHRSNIIAKTGAGSLSELVEKTARVSLLDD